MTDVNEIAGEPRVQSPAALLGADIERPYYGSGTSGNPEKVSIRGSSERPQSLTTSKPQDSERCQDDIGSRAYVTFAEDITSGKDNTKHDSRRETPGGFLASASEPKENKHKQTITESNTQNRHENPGGQSLPSVRTVTRSGVMSSVSLAGDVTSL